MGVKHVSLLLQDLVLWVTLGTHHVPHTEDVPVTPTTGGQLSFFLLPYNYHPRCPSVTSRDNVRLAYVTQGDPTSGIQVRGFKDVLYKSTIYKNNHLFWFFSLSAVHERL